MLSSKGFIYFLYQHIEFHTKYLSGLTQTAVPFVKHDFKIRFDNSQVLDKVLFDVGQPGKLFVAEGMALGYPGNSKLNLLPGSENGRIIV